MKVIYVTAQTNPMAAAAAVSQGVLQQQSVQIQVRSASAVQTMLIAIEAAQEYLFARGNSLMPLDGPYQPDDSGAVFAAVRLMTTEKDLPDDVSEPNREANEAELEAQIAADFAERQQMLGKSNELVEMLDEHTADSPILSGGDLDAAWDKADVGEETVGGMAPTPDQDRVDLLGEAAGLTYEDDEPLNTDAKLEARDRHRWELDPRSAETTDQGDEIDD